MGGAGTTLCAALLLATLGAAGPDTGDQPAATEPVVRPLPPPPTAEPSAADRLEADRAFDDARAKIREDLLKEAVPFLDRAVELHPTAARHRYRADVLAELGEHCRAFDGLLLALHLDPERGELREIERGLAATGPPCGDLGWLTIKVPHELVLAKVRLFLADAEVPAALPFGVRQGKHALRLRAAGHVATEHEIEIRAGEGLEWKAPQPLLSLAVPNPPASAEPARDTKTQPDPDQLSEPSLEPAPVIQLEQPRDESASSVLGWVLIAGGAGLAGAGTWAYLTGRSERDGYLARYRVEAGADFPTQAKRDEIQTSLDGWTTAAWTLWGAAGALAATGAVVLVLEPTEASPTVELRPVLGERFAGVQIGGQL